MTTPLSPTALTGTATTGATSKPDIKKVAQQFEAVFLRQMIGSMRQAGLSDGLFDSSASDQFRDMGDAKLADSMAANSGGGFGIAELLARQFGGTAGDAKPAGTATNGKATP